MTFKIFTLFINIFKQQKIPLGRWNIHNYKETILKIDYANKDNCGISSSIYNNIINIQHPVYYPDIEAQLGRGWKIDKYLHTSTRNYKIKKSMKKQNDYNKYMYMMGYESVHN
jgi:hypothetical protein